MADVISNIVPRPFDEAGILPENFVQNEQRILENMPVRAVRPEGGAFFVDTFVMYDANHVLVPESKYSFDLFSPTITEKIGRTIAGVAVLNDAAVPSPVYIDYHCVGGAWGVSNEAIIALFNRLMSNGRPTTWKSILGKPDAFKPAHHLQDIGDLYGAEYIVAALDRNTQAFLMGDSASHDEIFRAIDDLKGGNDEAMDQRINTLREELKLYIDQRDQYVLGQLQSAVDGINGRLNTVGQQLAAMDLRITQLSTSGTEGLAQLNQALTQHIQTTNAHGVTLASLGGYTKQEVDAMVNETNNKLGNFVKKDTEENLSLSVINGQLYGYVNGAWRCIFPAQWA